LQDKHSKLVKANSLGYCRHTRIFYTNDPVLAGRVKYAALCLLSYLIYYTIKNKATTKGDLVTFRLKAIAIFALNLVS
jgi:hypothetical protein